MASRCVLRWPISRRSAALALTISISACAPAASDIADRPGDGAQPVRALASSMPSEPSDPIARAKRGTLEVIVTDATGRRRPEVAVRIRTPDRRVLHRITDERGIVRERLAPGSYRVAVATGCHGRMQVTFGTSGRVGMTSGAIVRAPLRAEAIRRYAAGPPLLRSIEPPWRRDAVVDLLFRIYDRCTDRIMRRFAFDDLAFRPSGHLAVVDVFGRRTDARGLGRVRVRCVRPGPAALVLGDPANPNDGEDLLSFTPPLDPNAEWCG